MCCDSQTVALPPRTKRKECHTAHLCGLWITHLANLGYTMRRLGKSNVPGDMHVECMETKGHFAVVWEPLPGVDDSQRSRVLKY